MANLDYNALSRNAASSGKLGKVSVNQVTTSMHLLCQSEYAIFVWIHCIVFEFFEEVLLFSFAFIGQWSILVYDDWLTHCCVCRGSSWTKCSLVSAKTSRLRTSFCFSQATAATSLCFASYYRTQMTVRVLRVVFIIFIRFWCWGFDFCVLPLVL